ncbi:MAG: hypothetical protein GY750_06155 [Lentisphaerae bacterium]|nr:hypothetical protein [Lentisphaerota bacterium]MCP4100991.1 hypothetical protein [Lentisphaerota bacterium]
MNKTITNLQHKLHVIIDKAVKSHTRINDTISEVYYDNFKVLGGVNKKNRKNNH